MDERLTATAERLKETKAVELLQGIAGESWTAEPHDVILVQPHVARAWIKAGVAQDAPKQAEPERQTAPPEKIREATAPPKRDAAIKSNRRAAETG